MWCADIVQRLDEPFGVVPYESHAKVDHRIRRCWSFRDEAARSTVSCFMNSEDARGTSVRGYEEQDTDKQPRDHPEVRKQRESARTDVPLEGCTVHGRGDFIRVDAKSLYGMRMLDNAASSHAYDDTASMQWLIRSPTW